jgi:hypothetical protein
MGPFVDGMSCESSPFVIDRHGGKNQPWFVDFPVGVDFVTISEVAMPYYQWLVDNAKGKVQRADVVLRRSIPHRRYIVHSDRDITLFKLFCR